MKNFIFTTTGLFAIFATTAWCLPAQAVPAIDVQWKDVCVVARDQPLTITTSNGSSIEGRCISVTVTEISVDTGNHHIVKLARGTFSKVFVRPGNGRHELKSLGKNLHSALAGEVDLLLSQYGIFAAVAIPPTLAWGAIAAPFCAAGDIKHHFERAQEIRVL
jgi:hypothetical protein